MIGMYSSGRTSQTATVVSAASAEPVDEAEDDESSEDQHRLVQHTAVEPPGGVTEHAQDPRQGGEEDGDLEAG